MTDQTPRTEPGSDMPDPGAEDLQQVADEVAGGRADAASVTDATSDGTDADDGTDPGTQPGDGPDDDQASDPAGSPDPLGEALGLAEQRLGDLLRERAEFVNYRRRVERDREVAGTEARTGVLAALLPVLDDIDGARTHGDLSGPFAAVADKLDGVLRRLGLEPFGEVGEAFDPLLHEALLHDDATQVDVPTCTQVLQRGYRAGERVLRPARVAVASPQ